MANLNLFRYAIIIGVSTTLSASEQIVPDMYQNQFSINHHRNSYEHSDFNNFESPSSNSLQPNPGSRELRFSEYPIKCEEKITRVRLHQPGYDFFPTEYISRICTNSTIDPYMNNPSNPEICLHNDDVAGCQTKEDYIVILRKPSSQTGIDCWERKSQLVGVGCKCNVRFNYQP